MYLLNTPLNLFSTLFSSALLFKTGSSAAHRYVTTAGLRIGQTKKRCAVKITSSSSSAEVSRKTAPQMQFFQHGIASFKGYEVKRHFFLRSFHTYILPGLHLSGNSSSLPYNFPVNLFHTTPVLHRGFKTRSSENVTGSTSTAESSGSTTSKLHELLSEWKSKNKAKSQAEHSARIKTLLSNANLSPHEQQLIRIAFAEGYAATDSTKESRSSNILLNVIYYFAGSMVILYSVFLMYRVYSEIGDSFLEILTGTIANEVHPEEINVTFNDVKGADEAREELQQIVEFLRNPEKFSALGGKLPTGVLLSGPPGTGKTLLARAVAGEANVPFFHVAGPEFDEKFIGQGAKRIRDLFSCAKLRAPCVIFIDEIDSVGRNRVKSSDHPYANDTINQLLVEMDGFIQNSGIIVLAATNRRGDLDNALLRPGRFDVQITVPVPDMKGRKEILQLYLSKVKTDACVNVDVLAQGTAGFTGADLKNLVNQAAIMAATEDADTINMNYLECARDKVLMGPAQKSRIPDEETNIITAYHEAGHALVSHYTKNSRPLHKVTIIPHGPSLGHTAYIPEKEHYHVTKSQLLAQMDTLMGGRAAEELIFGPENITSGAADDLKQATSIALQMVKEWGMSDKIGVRTFEGNLNSALVDIGLSTSELIDAEINKLLSESLERAKEILRTHNKEHKAIANALLKCETLDATAVKSLIADNASKAE